MKFSSTPIQLCWGASIPHLKIYALFFCCPWNIVSITSLVLLQDLPQTYILSCFYRLFRTLSFSRIYVKYTSHHGWRKFSNLWFSDYWKKHLRLEKLNLNIFTHAPRQNSPPCSYHHPKAEGNYPLKQGTLSDITSYPYKVIDHYSFEMEVVETTRFPR